MRTPRPSTVSKTGRTVCAAALVILVSGLGLVTSALASTSTGRAPTSPELVAPGRTYEVAAVPPTTTVPPTVPPPTDNGFIPTDQNLSSCVGTLELPNCGSPDKSDLRLYLTFAILMLGMGFIGWRISVMVRRRDRTENVPDHTF